MVACGIDCYKLSPFRRTCCPDLCRIFLSHFEATKVDFNHGLNEVTFCHLTS